MRTEELLEACLQAMSDGPEIPPHIARYLAHHPEQRAEVEELIVAAQRAGRLPPAELPAASRKRMQERMAARMGVDPAMLAGQSGTPPGPEQSEQSAHNPVAPHRKRRWLLSTARLSLARLRYVATTRADADAIATARIRAAFCDLTPEDLRRYIGDRGEDYLYYRQRFPRWELIFALLATILRAFKRLERLANLSG
jgi:hypothetical protein